MENLNRAARRRQARLHQSLGLLAMRLPSKDPAEALRETARDHAAIANGLFTLLYNRTHGGAVFALGEALGRLIAFASKDSKHLAQGIQIAEGVLKTEAERAFREARDAAARA